MTVLLTYAYSIPHVSIMSVLHIVEVAGGMTAVISFRNGTFLLLKNPLSIGPIIPAEAHDRFSGRDARFAFV